MNDLMVKTVDVFGSAVIAAKDNNGTIWVGVKWMCQGMGMSEGQWKRQITNIQKDLLLSKAGSNLLLPTNGGEKDVFCLKNDYLPIWLAKISITPNIQKNNPELAEKLLEYQLKAKDILADAFLPKQENTGDVQGQIKLLAQGTTELYQRVETLEDRIVKFEEELPLFPEDADAIKNALNKKVVEYLGGKDSNAYRDRGIRQRVYNSIYANLKYNFDGVRTYKAIRRKDADRAVQIVNEYKPPLFLADQIENANAQQRLDV